MKPFFIYMLRCADGSYYVGHTDDLEQRIALHRDGTLGGYTALRRPVELIYRDEFATREEALKRELQIKGWSRAKKEALVRGDWAELKRLSKKRPSTPGSRREPSAQGERGRAEAGPKIGKDRRRAP